MGMDIQVLGSEVSSQGVILWGRRRCACSLGKNGVQARKVEGDGATPIGRFALRRAFWRPDRVDQPKTSLPLTALTPDMGWCDDPNHPDYNRFVTLPHPASCESLWREDGIYDVIVVLGHNDDPPVPGLGSAIFLHLRRPDRGPTLGCVALSLTDLTTLLAEIGPGDTLIIHS